MEVKYTEEIEVTETIQVEVPDDPITTDLDAEKKAAAEAAAAEARKAAEAAAQKAWEQEIARMNQEAFEKKLQEQEVQSKIKTSNEAQKTKEAQEAKEKEIQELSDKDFKDKVEKGDITISKVEVTDVSGEGIDEATKTAFMNSINAALNTAGAVFNGNYASQVVNAITNVSVNIMSGAVAAGQALKNLAFNMLGLVTGKAGVVVDQNQGTMTQYGTDGTKTVVQLEDDTDYTKLNEKVKEKGFAGALDWVKSTGEFKTETKYDLSGAEIYKAEKIGYDATNHAMAIQYSFSQAYNDQIYFTNVQAGDKKVVIENFFESGNKENAMVYSVGDGPGTKQKTSTGMEFTADIQSLDRVTQWSTKTVDGQTVNVAKSVDFIGGKDGKASAFEEAIVGSDGSVSVTRYDLTDAYYDTKQNPQTSESGGSSTTLVDEYKSVLDAANNMKLSGNSELYSGYEFVDNSWINMNKIEIYSYSTSNPQSITKSGVEIGNGNKVSVTAEFVGSDWRYNLNVKDNSDLLVQYAGSDGKTYTINATAKGKDWTNLAEATFDNSTAKCQKYFDGVLVVTSSDVTFSFKDGFKGGSFSNPQNNTAIIDGTIITGVDVSTGKAKTIDGSQFKTTIDGVTYSGTLTGTHNVKSWTDGLSYNDDGTVANTIAYGMLGDKQIRTSFGITFDKDTKMLGGVKFDVATINAHSDQYAALTENGAWITGIEVSSSGDITYIDGAGFDYTDENGVRYVGTLEGTDNIENWTDGLSYNDDGTVANTIAYGMFGDSQIRTSFGITFDKTTGIFGVKFDAETINANKMEFAVLQNGAWITGIEIGTSNEIKYIDGSQFDVTVNGVRYIGTLTGTGKIENWAEGLSYNDDGTVANTVAYGMFGDSQIRTSFGITFNKTTKTFGGVKFDEATINANKMQFAVLENGAWITGIEISPDGIQYIEGSGFDYTDENGTRYVGTLTGTGKIENWTDGLTYNDDGTVANTVAYGTFVNGGPSYSMRTSFGITFNKTTKTFGGVKFDTATINANRDKYSVLQDGIWITGVEVKWDSTGKFDYLNYIDGAQIDVTVDGIRYIGSLTGTGKIENWTNGLKYNTDGTVTNFMAYGMFNNTQMRTTFGIIFDKTTKTFGGVKFDVETINANGDKYGALASNGAWITGINIISGQIKTIDGAGFDYTASDGTRYVGELTGTHSLDNWTEGLSYNDDGTVANTVAYGMLGDKQLKTTFAITFDKETGMFGVKFDATTINANKDKFAVLQDGIWITGIEVSYGGGIKYIDGAQYDVTVNGVRYMGTLTGTGRIENWSNGLKYNSDGTVANAVAYGTFVNGGPSYSMRTSFGIKFDKTTKTFGGVKFDTAAINANKDKFAVLQDGIWITGVEVKWNDIDGFDYLNYIDGAQYDVTVDGIRYIGSLTGTGKIENWAEGLSYNDDGTVANTIAYGMFGDRQIRTSFGITFNKTTGAFGVKFDETTINANKTQFAVLENGAWITGIEITADGINYIDGANFDYTDANGIRYVGSLAGTGSIENWTDGLTYNDDGTVANTVAYGTFVNGGPSYSMRTSFGITFDKTTKTFGGVKFDTKTINANKDKYAVLQDGIWITGVEVRWNNNQQYDYLNYIDGAQIDVTVDGIRYIGSLTGTGKIENWTNGLKYNKDGTVADFMAYGMFNDRQMRTTFGIIFDKTTKTFGGVKFDVETINAHGDQYAAMAEDGAWITGINIIDGQFKTIDGAGFDYTQSDGRRYVGTLTGTHNLDSWTKGLTYNSDGTVANAVAYGTFVNGGPSYLMRTSFGITFNKDTGVFGSKFDTKTINANKDKYSAYDEASGTWISNIAVAWDSNGKYDYLKYVDGSQIQQGNYSATLKGSGRLGNWASAVKKDTIAYSMTIDGIIVTTTNGIVFNKTTGKFSGATFSNSKKNTAIVYAEGADGKQVVTYITGIVVDIANGKLTFIDGAKVQQGKFTATLKGTGDVKNWMSAVNKNSLLKYGSYYGYTSSTSTGVSFDSKTGLFSSTSQTDKVIKNKSYKIYTYQKNLQNIQNLSNNLTSLQAELAKAKSNLNSMSYYMGSFYGAGEYYKTLQNKIKALEAQIETTSKALYSARLNTVSGQNYTATQKALSDYVSKMGYGSSMYGYYAMQYDPEYQRLSKAASDASAIFNAQSNLKAWQDINDRMNLPPTDPQYLERTTWRENIVNEYMAKYQQAAFDQLNMDYNGIGDMAFAAYATGKTGDIATLKADFIKTITIGDNMDVIFKGVIAPGFVEDSTVLSGTYNGTYDLHVSLGGVTTAQMTDQTALSPFILNSFENDDIKVITDYSGYITNIGVNFTEAGFEFTGSFDFVNTNVGAKYTEINLQTGVQNTELGGVVPTVNTAGIIDQSIAGQTTLSGYNSILTFNSGTAVIIGEGATAWSGSQLQSAGGIVTTSGGNYVFSGGTWGGDADANFKFNDPLTAQTNLEKAFENAGLNVTGLDKINYSGTITGNISANAMTMLDTMLRQESNALIPQDAINAGVTGDTYALSNGIILSKGALFNISLQSIENGQKVLGFKALNDINVSSYDMVEGWTSDKGTSFENIKFATGEFITIENILDKSGATYITNEHTTWNSVDIGEITLNINSTVKGNYSTFGNTYFELAGNGGTVSDGKDTYETTNLIGNYNGTAFTILAGAKISMGIDGSISVIKGDVYVKDMYVPASKSDGSTGTGSGEESDAYFRGTALGVDQDGNIIDVSNVKDTTEVAGWKTTGVFFNYSDSSDKGAFFSQGSLFADNSRLNDGSWHYNYGLVDGSINIKIITVEKVVDGKTVTELKEIITADGSSASMEKWSADGSKIVMEMNSTGIKSVYQVTDGNVQGQKYVYFETENIQGYNVVATAPNGQYIIKEIVGKNYINEVILATGGANDERIIEREELNGTIKCNYDKTTDKYTYEYPADYSKSYTFFDNNLHKDGTTAKTWDVGDGDTVFTINEGENIRAFSIEDGVLNEFTAEVSLGKQDVLQSGQLEFKFVYEDGKGKIIADGTIEKAGQIDGKSFTAIIGYDSSKGGLYLVNADDIKIILSNDEAWAQLTEEAGIGYMYEQQLSTYNTYEEYLAGLMYGASGTYDEETGRYIVTEADVDAYLEDSKNGKGGENYAGMTRDEFLHENQLFTREEFEQAKRDGAKYAILLPEDMRTETRKAVLSDVVFTGEFDSGLRDQYGQTIKIELDYQIMGSSFDANGLSVTARLTLTGEQRIKMEGSIEVPDGQGEGGSDPVDRVITRVTATVDGKDITLETTGDYDAQFDVTFNAMVGANDIFKPTFSNFIAGTELTLIAGSNIQSAGNQTLTNSGVKDVYGVSYDVNVTANTTFLLSKDTKLYELAGAVAKAIEDGNIKTAGVSVDRIITDNLGNKIASNISSIYIDTRDYYPDTAKWTSTYTAVNPNDTNNTFGSGKYNPSENRVEFGFWDGHVNTNVADITISKNWFASTLQAVGGFLGSIVGFVVDPFVQAANAIADLFTGEFSWEKLGNAAWKTFGAFTGMSWGDGLASGITSWINGDGFGAGWNAHYANNQILNWSASMMLDKSYADVVRDGDAGKAAVMGLVAVATIAFVVLTGGLGAAALPALFGGTTTVTALVGAATATVWSTVGLAASALVTSYFVSTAAMNAAVAFEKGDIAGGLLNVGAAILAFLFPIRIGSAAANAKAAIDAGAKTFAQGTAAAVAAQTAKQAAAEAAKKAAAELAEETAKKTAVQGAKQALTTSAKSFITNPWGIRATIAGVSASVDLAFANQQNGVLDGFRALSPLQLLRGLGINIGGEISEHSWLNSDFLGIKGLKWGSMMPILGYVAGPGLAKGAIGIAKTVVGKNLAWSALKESVVTGFAKSASNLGSLFRTGERLTAWGGIAANMYSMAGLQVFMSTAANIYKDTNGFGMSDGYMKGLMDFIFGGMSNGGNVLAINPGQSMFFGVVMYGAMPIFQGLFGGVKELFATRPAVDVATSSVTKSVFEKFANTQVGQVSNRLVGGLVEEGLEENIIQGLLTPFVGANTAEYLSEFLSPDGNMSVQQYFETAMRANYTTQESAQYTADNMNQHLTNSGYNGIQVTIVQNAQGTYGLAVSGSIIGNATNVSSFVQARIPGATITQTGANAITITGQNINKAQLASALGIQQSDIQVNGSDFSINIGTFVNNNTYLTDFVQSKFKDSTVTVKDGNIVVSGLPQITNQEFADILGVKADSVVNNNGVLTISLNAMQIGNGQLYEFNNKQDLTRFMTAVASVVARGSERDTSITKFNEQVTRAQQILSVNNNFETGNGFLINMASALRYGTMPVTMQTQAEVVASLEYFGATNANGAVADIGTVSNNEQMTKVSQIIQGLIIANSKLGRTISLSGLNTQFDLASIINNITFEGLANNAYTLLELSTIGAMAKDKMISKDVLTVIEAKIASVAENIKTQNADSTYTGLSNIEVRVLENNLITIAKLSSSTKLVDVLSTVQQELGNRIEKQINTEIDILQKTASQNDPRLKFILTLQQIAKSTANKAELVAMLRGESTNNAITKLMTEYKQSIETEIITIIDAQNIYTSDARVQAKQMIAEQLQMMTAMDLVTNYENLITGSKNVRELLANQKISNILSPNVKADISKYLTVKDHRVNIEAAEEQKLENLSAMDLIDLGIITVDTIVGVTGDNASKMILVKIDGQEKAKEIVLDGDISQLNMSIFNRIIELMASANTEYNQLLANNASTAQISEYARISQTRAQGLIDKYKNNPMELLSQFTVNSNRAKIFPMFAAMQDSMVNVGDITTSDGSSPLRVSLTDMYVLQDTLFGAERARTELNKLNQSTEYILNNKDTEEVKELLTKLSDIGVTLGDIKILSVLQKYNVSAQELINKAALDKGQSIEVKNMLQDLCNTEAPGFDKWTDLLPRIQALKISQVTLRDTYESEIQNEKTSGKTIEQMVQDFISDPLNKTSVGTMINGKKVFNFNEGTLDILKTRMSDLGLNDKQQVNFLRLFMYEALKSANIYGGGSLRASQSEMTAAMQNDTNAALGMGAGKTIAIVVDAAVHRVLMGGNTSMEILVGNSALDNFAGAGTASRLFFEFLGLKVAKITDFKSADGGQTDIVGLAEAYADPNTIIIMDPTVRGHLKNEAVNLGGLAGSMINKALDGVTRVAADEIHLWALTRTAAVIGGNNAAPSTDIIEEAIKIGNAVDMQTIVSSINKINTQMLSNSAENIIITVDGKPVAVRRFRTVQDLQNYQLNQGENQKAMIAIVGERSADIDVRLLGNAQKLIGKAIGDMNNAKFRSVIKGLFTVSDNGGAAFGADGTVKPVSTRVEENMVISDIYYQMGYAMQQAIAKEGFSSNDDIAKFLERTTRVSDTTMQTSLAAIYAGSNATMVGVSGTVAGLQQLIINRTGSDEVYNISGETVDMNDTTLEIPQMNGTVDQQVASLSAVIAKVLAEGDTTKLDNILMLARTSTSLDVIRKAVKANFGALQKAGITVYEYTDTRKAWKDVVGDEVEFREFVGDENSIDKTAKNKNIKRLIIANEAGATGVDYQGNFANIILDAHLMSNTDLAQALKRTARPDGAGGRWATQRYIAYNSANFTAQIESFASNEKLIQFAQEAWKGEGEYEHLKNPRGLKLLSKLTGNQKLTTSEQVELVSMIRDMYDINSAIRFAVTDSIRDRMVLSPLRQLLEVMPDGVERETVRKALEDALQQKNYSKDADLSVSEASLKADTADQIIENAFNNSYAEAQMIFNRLNLSGTSKAMIDAHMSQIDTAKANYDNIEVVKDMSLSSAVDIYEFVGVIKSFKSYIAPMMVQQATSQNILVDNAISTQNLDATQTELANKYKNAILANPALYTEIDGKKYLTEQGLAYAKIAQNGIVNRSAMQTILKLLFSLLGGAGIPPEDEEKLLAGVTDKLFEKGITNVNGILSFINIASNYEEGALSNMSFTQFKNIVNATYPQGFVENAKKVNKNASYVLPTAQSIEMAKLFNSESRMLNQYNATVEQYYKGIQYKIDVKDRKNILDKQYPFIANTSRFIGGTLSYLTLLPFIGIFNKLYGVNPNAQNISFDQTFKQTASLASAKMVKSIGQKPKQEQKGIVDYLMTGVLKASDLVSQFINGLSFKDSIKQLDKLANPALEDVFAQGATNEDIISAMATAGIQINQTTTQAIANAQWLKEKMPELFAQLKLTDIAGLEKLTGVIEIAKKDENFKIGLDYDSLKSITSGQKTVLEMLAPDFAEKLGLQDVSSIDDQIEKLNAFMQNNKILKDTTVLQISEVIKELGLDPEYAMALLYPTKNPNDMLTRFNKVANTSAYAKTITMSELSNNNNFVDENGVVSISDGLKQDVLLRTPYGDLTNKERQSLAGNVAKNNANDILRILGASKEAEDFVNQLSLGVLSDKEFVKALIKLISKTSRDAINIKASDIYNNEGLADKINAIYQQKERSGQDKIAGVKDLINKISVEKAKAVQASPVVQAAEFVKNCADATVETLGKIIPLRPLTQIAVQMNPFAEDGLLVAGINESLDKATTMGEIRAKTGFEYRTVERAELATLDTPFVAYVANKASNTGHVITVTKVSDGKITYSDNTVTDGQMTIDKLYEMGFEGLVLASPEAKAGIKVDSLNQSVENMLGKEVYDKLSVEAKQLANEIINGVTKPQDMNTVLSALLAVCKDVNAISQLVLDKDILDKDMKVVTAIDSQEITAKYYEKIGEVLSLSDVSDADKQVSIKLLAMARDVLFMANKNPQAIALLNSSSVKVEDIMPMLVISKAVNQNVIVADSKTSVVKANNGDFVIDIEKLQNVIKEKISITDAKKALEDLSAMLETNGRGSASMPISLMKLSDIRAVAQAA
ncbi:MAG: hypothetical protein PHR82_05375 [Endomicrobiaceae bacterium]|nr:hypothetical protein [Endomicrobiaceae bacterium]